MRSYCMNHVAAGIAAALVVLGASACSKKADQEESTIKELHFPHIAPDSLRLEMARFAPVEIAYDETILSAAEKDALAKLVAAAHEMDEIFLRQVWEGNVAMRNDLAKAAQITGPNQPLSH